MSCCCRSGASDKPADGESKKTDVPSTFTKGSSQDISQGPVKNRRCTDVACLVIFIIHWIVFWVVSFAGTKNGNPWKLYRPRDYKGDYCGIYPHESGIKLLFTMNVSTTVEDVAKQMVCSSASRTQLKTLMTNDDYLAYQCACCYIPCSTCVSTLSYPDLVTGAQINATVSARMSELTNVQQASNMFTPGSSNSISFSANDIWQNITKFFNAVCMGETCMPPNSTNLTRNYTYTPAPDVKWKLAWDTLKTKSQDVLIKNAISQYFTFRAYSSDLCPYPARYCVPFPGITFSDGALDYCVPKLDQAVVTSIGDSAASALEEQGITSLTSAAEGHFGSAMGTFMATLDAFVVTACFGFVFGLVFLVLLRFVVGFVVWLSLFLVTFLLAGSGAVAYVRSFQCAGSTIFSTGLQASVAVVMTVQTKAQSTLTGQVLSEAMTGKGFDYHGGQTRTINGKLCQRWDLQQPHQHTWTPAVYPGGDLTNNHCRNPTNGSAYESPTIWCLTTDANKVWEQCSPVGAIKPKCLAGYAVQSETARQALQVCSYILWALSGAWLIVILCICKRIRLAIAVNKVAAMFVYNNPRVLLVPVIQVVLGVCWVLIWMCCASFLLSNVPTDYVPSESYSSYAEAYGTDTTPGACTNKWPTGFAYKYEGDLLAANDTCSGSFGNTTGIVPKCWRCGLPRYVFDARFVYIFFTLLWNNAFMIAVGQCIIAGACACWFFTKQADRGKTHVLSQSVRNAFRYHAGSLAFGAFILALVQFIRYMLKYFEEQAKAQKNRLLALILRVVQCILFCFEKCVKFLNKNAYIQVAILGTNFCTSAKNAFFLILRNIIRFGVVAVLGSIIQFIGFAVITTGTFIIGYFILQAFHPNASPVLPVMVYMVCGYLIALLFMNVFSMAVDTSLQCFIAAEEMGVADEFVPGPLQSLIDHHASKKQPDADVAKVAPA